MFAQTAPASGGMVAQGASAAITIATPPAPTRGLLYDMEHVLIADETSPYYQFGKWAGCVGFAVITVGILMFVVNVFLYADGRGDGSRALTMAKISGISIFVLSILMGMSGIIGGVLNVPDKINTYVKGDWCKKSLGNSNCTADASSGSLSADDFEQYRQQAMADSLAAQSSAKQAQTATTPPVTPQDLLSK